MDISNEKQENTSYLINFNHLHHIVLWFCWKHLSNFCVSCGDALLSLLVYSARVTPKKQAPRLESNTNHCDNHLQSNEGYFKTSIQDNIPKVKIGYSFTKLSFQENNWKQ